MGAPHRGFERLMGPTLRFSWANGGLRPSPRVAIVHLGRGGISRRDLHGIGGGYSRDLMVADMRNEEASKPPRLSDKEVYQAAKLLIDQHAEDAAIHAAMEAERLFAAGALTGSAAWRRVINRDYRRARGAGAEPRCCGTSGTIAGST